jgi:hypothetical protein
MNRRVNFMVPRVPDSRLASAFTTALVHAGVAFAIVVLHGHYARAVVVTDDFSDNNDTANPAWTHLHNAVGSTGQTWTVTDGKYRLFSPTGTTGGTTDPNLLELAGYDFVGSYTGPEFTGVRVSADFVDLPIGAQSPISLPSWFGVAARLNGDNSPPSATTGIQLHGYTYHFESSADNGNGEMVLGFLWGQGIKDIGSQKVHLDPTQDYRFVLEVLGDVLHGQVYHLDGTPNGTLVAEDFRDVVAEPVNDDHDFDEGTPDEPLEPYASGFSGVFGVGHVFFFEPDFTADNFRTETAVAGDYNRNGEVDAADYVLWRETLDTASPDANPPSAFSDMSANGAVTNGYTQTIEQADYDFWQANFGTSVAAGSGLAAAVPEPASVVLLFLGVCGVHWMASSRRRVGGRPAAG